MRYAAPSQEREKPDGGLGMIIDQSFRDGSKREAAKAFVRILTTQYANEVISSLPLTEQSYMSLRRSCKLQDGDVLKIAKLLGIQSSTDRGNPAQTLFRTLTDRGSVEAAKYGTYHMLQLMPNDPTLLKLPQVKQYRHFLRTYASFQTDPFLVSLETSIMLLEDPEAALKMVRDLAPKLKFNAGLPEDTPYRVLVKYFSQRLHNMGEEHVPPTSFGKILKEITELGVIMDEAHAHHNKAILVQEAYKEDEGNKIRNGLRIAGPVGFCKEWLYYMTKAASSGYARAAHALGEFYSTHPFQEIDNSLDFVPKHDDYPSADDSPPLLPRILRAFGLARRLEPIETAAMVSDLTINRDNRLRLAGYWYQAAAMHGYVPSHVALAEMFLNRSQPETISSAADQTKHKSDHVNHDNDIKEGFEHLRRARQGIKAYSMYYDAQASQKGRVPLGDRAVQGEVVADLISRRFGHNVGADAVAKSGILTTLMSVDVFNQWAPNAKEVARLRELLNDIVARTRSTKMDKAWDVEDVHYDDEEPLPV